MTDANRNRDIRAIKTGQRDLALTDDSYRDLLQRITGKRSAADLDAAERAKVLEEFRRIGFKPKGGKPRRAGNRPLVDTPTAKKIRALWLSLWHLNAVRDPSEDALEKFVKRIAKVDSLAWLKAQQSHAVIEALKDWCLREGYLVHEMPADATKLDFEKELLKTIWLKIKRVKEPAYQHDKWHFDNWIMQTTEHQCSFATLDGEGVERCLDRARKWLAYELKWAPAAK